MSNALPTMLATATLAASGLASPAAQAQNLAFQSSGTAQVVQVIDPNGPVLRFATQTEGSGSFGLTGYLSSDIVNLATGVGNGTNRFVASNGDELLGAFTVQATPGAAPDALVLAGLTQFQGGTGIFQGASGSASFSGSGQFISETQALVSFSHVGQLSLVPEPAAAALLLGGLAAVGMAKRQQG